VTVTHIFTSPGHDFKGRHGHGRRDHGVVTHECVVCEAGRGLRDDRYAAAPEGHKGQVTFFNAEVLEEIGEQLGIEEVPPHAFRRNVVLAGIDLNELVGRRFTLGGIRFAGTEPCSPCHWMDVALVDGTADLLAGKGGLRARILESGILCTGPTELTLDS
jgi:MOSC domain-containing protein YiiM